MFNICCCLARHLLIICGECLAEIINKVNLKGQGNEGDVESRNKIEAIKVD